MPPSADTRHPRARAEAAFQKRESESILRAAIKHHHSLPRPNPKAVLEAYPQLGLNPRQFRERISQRDEEGVLFERNENDVMMDHEIDELISMYRAKGYSGSCGLTEQTLLRDGAAALLDARPSPQRYTKHELVIVTTHRGRNPSLAWCQMIAEMAKILINREVSPRRLPA